MDFFIHEMDFFIHKMDFFIHEMDFFIHKMDFFIHEMCVCFVFVSSATRYWTSKTNLYEHLK